MMDFVTSIDPTHRTINVEVTCLLDQNIRKKILNVISFHMNTLSYRRALIDLKKSTFREDEPITGALELINFMRTIDIPTNAKMAFVNSEAENHRKYFEKIADVNEFNIRYFRSCDDANAWLEK